MSKKLDINELLEKYLENKSKLATAEATIKGLEDMLQCDEQIRNETEMDAIEGDCMPAPVLSDIPKSETNKFHSATENTALNYKNKAWYAVDNEIYYLEIIDNNERKKIQLDILKQKKDKIPYETIVNQVDALMLCLNDKEKYVIDLHCIRQYTIPETVQRFASEFGYGSQTNVKELKQKALSKMESIYNRKSA